MNMKHTLMKSLIKANSDKALDVEALIDKYLLDIKATNKAESQAFLSDLLVYVMKHLEDNKDKQLILDLVDTKIAHLGYSIDSSTLEEIYTKSALSTAVGIQAVFEFDKQDAKVIESINRSLLWLKEDGTQNTQNKLKEVITSAMKGDITTAQIGEVLREKFDGLVSESERYFTGVSDHIIRQSQSLTRINQYNKAGIEYVQAIAKIDTHTSEICKSMHKRIIPIKHLSNQANAIMSATDIETKKSVSAWQSAPIFGKLPTNVGMSPYHFGCRTVMVAYFPKDEEIDGENVDGSLVAGDTHNKEKVEYSQKIPKFDKEVIVTDKTMKNDISNTDAIKGLKSIDRMELSITNPLQTVAYSKDTKLLYTIEDGSIVSITQAKAKEFDTLTKENDA